MKLAKKVNRELGDDLYFMLYEQSNQTDSSLTQEDNRRVNRLVTIYIYCRQKSF